MASDIDGGRSSIGISLLWMEQLLVGFPNYNK